MVKMVLSPLMVREGRTLQRKQNEPKNRLRKTDIPPLEEQNLSKSDILLQQTHPPEEASEAGSIVCTIAAGKVRTILQQAR
jgi:hypothetical protein